MGEASAAERRQAGRTRSPRRNRAALPVLLSMVFLYQSDTTVVNAAGPALREDLGASPAGVQLVISAYLIASASLIVVASRLGARYGFGRVFLVGVLLFGSASLLCAVTGDVVGLVAARALQGVGGALAFPQALTGIQLIEDGPRRARALGWYAAALALGAAAGQLVGGVLLGLDLLGLGWRTVFLVNLPITAAALVVGRRALRESRPRERVAVDVAGATTLFLALLAAIVPLSLGREVGWPAWTWTALGGAVGLLALFIAIERRRSIDHRGALLDLPMLGRRDVFWALWPQALTSASYLVLLYALAVHVQAVLHRGPLASGLLMLPWVLAFAVPGRLLHRLPRRSRGLPPIAGGLVLAAAYLGLSLLVRSGAHSLVAMVPMLILGGLGAGATFSSMLARLVSAAPRDRAAEISGVSTTVMQLVGAVAVAGLGSFFVAQTTLPGGRPDQALAVLSAVLCGVALAAAVLGGIAVAAGRPSAGSRRDGAVDQGA